MVHSVLTIPLENDEASFRRMTLSITLISINSWQFEMKYRQEFIDINLEVVYFIILATPEASMNW
jgi:hypothetical protein